MKIRVAGRKSPLSRAQIKEVFNEIRNYFPPIEFDLTLTETVGDLDLKTSLRTLDKTNFFTKEVDELVLSKFCDIGIHSAKDLPDPIPKNLTIIALTKGVDTSDSLVLKTGETIDSLKKNAVIATSSFKREETVKSLRADLIFQDIRGTIAARLNKLETGAVDGVVVAEAALIRLKLTHLNRITLPGETTPLQGKLAILAHVDNLEMKELFSCLDIR